jgi:homocysteine S-methyltransferase
LRANPDWGAKIGYGQQALANINRAVIDLMCEVRQAYETERPPIVISGALVRVAMATILARS